MAALSVNGLRKKKRRERQDERPGEKEYTVGASKSQIKGGNLSQFHKQHSNKNSA